MLDKLTIDDFESLRGQPLRLRVGQRIENAEVAEAQPWAATPPPGQRQPFSVILLAGSSDNYWPQGICVLEHPEHGDLELFMVPLGPQGDRIRYEVNFS